MTVQRVTQEVVEVLADGTPALRVTQEVVEVLGNGTPALRLSQEVVEILSTNTPTDLLLTQETVEVLSSTSSLPTNLRVTQEVVEVLSLAPPELDVTSLIRLTLEQPASSAEVTSLLRLSTVQLFAQQRISSMIRLTLADVIPCLTHWIVCWRIERQDGVVFTFTSHDLPVNFKEETYTPCASLSANASELGAKLGDVGNSELLGIVTDDSISDVDILGGLFDGALIEVWLVPWIDAGGEVPRRLIAGRTGKLNSGDKGFKMEVLTPSAALQQHSITETYTPSCRYDLGDDRCTINLPALQVSGSATAVGQLNAATQAVRRTFYDTSRVEATGYFNAGRLTWTSGDNIGATSEIKSYDLTTGQIILWQPTIYPISIGDAYEMVPGCDKTKGTCQTKFNNYVNFGGFPDIPGIDAISRGPGN
jgi:uncharacterized phage protein (TIGR02218 family)